MDNINRAILITVRSDSSRLPNKALLKILDKSTIEMVILRAKLSKLANKVILCTTTRPIDNQLVEIALKNEIDYYRGSLNDKLDRWLGAVNKFNVDVFSTFDGDDLLADPFLIDKAFIQIEDRNLDYLKTPTDIAVGAFTYCIKSNALKKVCDIKNSNETEMMWTYFEDTGLFKTGALEDLDEIFYNPDIRLTLDYQEDFDFFEIIFKHFNNANNDVELKKVIEFLNHNPQIIKINSIRQNEWKQNQINKTKLVLKG